MKEVKIHIVCRGNVYRSRLVEAYMQSFNKQHYTITSSGIEAEKHYPDEHFLSPLAVAIGQQHNLSSYFSAKRTQTTDQLLAESDIIVFVNSDVYRDARHRYAFNDNKSVVWSISDIRKLKKALANRKAQNKTFRLIERHVNELFNDDLRGSWVDIVDEDNHKKGFSLPVSLANKKGQWHNGCHAIISLPDRSVVVEKRSSNIIFSPGLIDITLGGIVDSGEDPETAMIREIQEELGLTVSANQLRLLSVKKWNSYHPRYKRHSRSFIYTYHLGLQSDQPIFNLQASEVAAVKILSPRKLKLLILRHRLRNFGRLSYGYAYYSKILRLAELL